MEKQYFTISQATSILQISKMTIWRKIQTGEIPSVRLGRKYLIPNEFFEKLKSKAIQSLEKKGAD